MTEDNDSLASRRHVVFRVLLFFYVRGNQVKLPGVRAQLLEKFIGIGYAALKIQSFTAKKKRCLDRLNPSGALDMFVYGINRISWFSS